MYYKEWQSRITGTTLRVESEVKPIEESGLLLFPGVSVREEVREYPDIEFSYQITRGGETWVISKSVSVEKISRKDGSRVSNPWLMDCFMGSNLAVFRVESGDILKIKDHSTRRHIYLTYVGENGEAKFRPATPDEEYTCCKARYK